jgi:hypothetical protein
LHDQRRKKKLAASVCFLCPSGALERHLFAQQQQFLPIAAAKSIFYSQDQLDGTL